MSDKGDYVSVAGKITTWSYGRIMRIMKRLGITIYVMIQNMCDCIIRYMDDKHNLTPESEKVMSMFEHLIGWENNFNLCDPDAKPEIAEATYFLNDANGKKGVRAMHVKRPFFDKWEQTFNIKDIFERFFCLIAPGLYKRYRYIAICRECASIIELLNEIIGELESEENKKELLKPFEDANRAENGKPLEYGRRTRIRQHKDPYFQELNFNDTEDGERTEEGEKQN